MRVHDIMTTDVVTVTPETPIHEIAAILLERRISAVPVIDAGRRVIGLVSEGDLLHRVETGTARSRSRWFEFFNDSSALARDFVKSHGRRAGDVMTRRVVSVTEDMKVAELARLLSARRVKRVPVLRDGKLAGIVSRADLLRGLNRKPANDHRADDRSVREAIVTRLRAESWARPEMINVVVEDGAVELLGFAGSEEQKHAIRALAETTAGDRVVHDRLEILPRRLLAA